MLFILLSVGPASAQITPDISNAVYLNPSYLQELTPKTNCDLNGAWSTEYSYYWLADPTNSQTKLPPYVKNISYSGVIQENSSISISTLESPSANKGRNKYYLSSSLNGETLVVNLELENINQFKTWLSLNLYFDPSVIKNPEQQIKLKLSYANSTLGNIIYIQDTKFNAGCYLDLLVKSPDPGATGKLTIEIDAQSDSLAAISGIFWDEPRKESNLQVTYTGLNKVSAPVWQQNLRDSSATAIWSPQSREDSSKDNFAKVGVGEITYTTSTGYEFPESLKKKDAYNFKVLMGIAGPKGVNGLEFYLTPDSNLCSNGCELGLYSTELYKQSVSIYSAEEDKKNKLTANAETPGDGSPVFQNFHIAPNSNVKLRVRLTTSDLNNPPILRGLYISPDENINLDNDNVVLNIDEGTSSQSSVTLPNNNTIISIPITEHASIINVDFPNIPDIKSSDKNNKEDNKDSIDKDPSKTDQNKANAIGEAQKASEEVQKVKQKESEDAPKAAEKIARDNLRAKN
ncbi:MAG: hypothetical protein A3F80_00820 [Candidatus Melainabacteria bacterium RIFCSPLOWO2_12_FULL_35_11]|nr:MAG: hypothetical protein A3F80_00820 [Candidatus Melainabacteria bacterium RIFCSPLOWO2_12_FULL_35_11]